MGTERGLCLSYAPFMFRREIGSWRVLQKQLVQLADTHSLKHNGRLDHCSKLGIDFSITKATLFFFFYTLIMFLLPW